jgi:hypothetical protein
MINANYIIVVFGKFRSHRRKKIPEMLKRHWFFTWDKALVHTATVVRNWIAAKGAQVLPHPTDLRQQTSSCSGKSRQSSVASSPVPMRALKQPGKRLSRVSPKKNLLPPFWRWFERCKKCTVLKSGAIIKKFNK